MVRFTNDFEREYGKLGTWGRYYWDIDEEKIDDYLLNYAKENNLVLPDNTTRGHATKDDLLELFEQYEKRYNKRSSF